MSKGFAKPPKKYSANDLWFCSHNWENGFYGTLDECLDRIQHCFSPSQFSIFNLLASEAAKKAKTDQTVADEIVSHLEKIEEKIWEQEQQRIAQIRSQVRDDCLRYGKKGNYDSLNHWDIYFKGKRGKP